MKGVGGRTQYIVGGYLRRKRHEQQIDGRPPGPEWVLRGPRTATSFFLLSFFPRPRDFVPVAPHCPAEMRWTSLTTSARVFGRSRFRANGSFMRALSSYTLPRGSCPTFFQREKPSGNAGESSPSNRGDFIHIGTKVLGTPCRLDDIDDEWNV